MKLSGLPITTITLLFLFLDLFSTSPASAQALPRLHSIQADFIQEKHLEILVRPLVSTGTFTFQAPQSLRWEYRTPVPSILLMDGGHVKKYIARDGRLVEDTGMRLDSMQVMLSQISNWLDGRFTDNDMFSVSYTDEHTVLLTPKEQGLAGVISKIELKLSDRKGLLDGVTIFEGANSYTSMTFKNTVLNKEIPDSVFTEK